MSEGVRGTVVGTRCAEDGHLVTTLDVAALAVNKGDEVTIYPGHEERYTEAEWWEKQAEQRPQEVIERAREWLADSMSDADLAGTVVAGREVMRDLLAYAEAAPPSAPSASTRSVRSDED